MDQLMAEKLRRGHRREIGFTLVELLVVIAIIAVLISLLLPSLEKARFEAKVVACASNQHQIYLACVMYANDNNGYLPGTDAWYADQGAIYLQSWAYYPWENTDWSFYNGNDLAPGIWATTIRWYGVGMLVGNHYIAPTTVVACTDFTTPNNSNFSYGDNFTLTPAYYQTGGNVQQMWTGVYPCVAVAGSYVLNTIPYYAPDAPAHGKLGGRGRPGGYFAGYVNELNIDALIMCFTSQSVIGTSDQFDGPAIAHQYKGVNCTYRDGHVDWLPLSNADWNMLTGPPTNWPNSTEFDLAGHYQTSFWNWATQYEPNE